MSRPLDSPVRHRINTSASTDQPEIRIRNGSFFPTICRRTWHHLPVGLRPCPAKWRPGSHGAHRLRQPRIKHEGGRRHDLKLLTVGDLRREPIIYTSNASRKQRTSARLRYSLYVWGERTSRRYLYSRIGSMNPKEEINHSDWFWTWVVNSVS